MSTPGFYRSFPSQRWSVFFSVSVFVSFVLRRKNHHSGRTQAKALQACCSSWPHRLASSWLPDPHLLKQTWLWVPCVKTGWGFSFHLILCPESLALWLVRIFSLFSTIGKVRLLVYVGGQGNSLGFCDTKSQAALSSPSHASSQGSLP